MDYPAVYGCHVDMGAQKYAASLKPFAISLSAP
jgi:hypothetical protein